MIGESQIILIKSKIFRVKKYPKQSIALGILAGIFIAIGALLMCIAKTEGCNKIVCGMIFSCGLFFVVVTGAELFTGNCIIRGLILQDRSENGVSLSRLLITNYISNMIGALIMVVIVLACKIDYSILVDMTVAKCNESFLIIFARGFACNLLVCLAIWMGVYIEPTHSKIERFVAVLFPVTAFVACGFEHSVANMFILPFGLLAGQIDIIQLVMQLLIVTLGNWFGGVFIGFLLGETMRED